jgi:hypothetical protein
MAHSKPRAEMVSEKQVDAFTLYTVCQFLVAPLILAEHKPCQHYRKRHPNFTFFLRYVQRIKDSICQGHIQAPICKGRSQQTPNVECISEQAARVLIPLAYPGLAEIDG